MKNGQFSQFELKLKEAVELIRSEIKGREDIGSFRLTILAEGRVDGELKVEFKIENTYDNKANVEGGNLQQAVIEYLRRNEWAKFNQPLCLPNVAKSINDEIPF